MRVILNALARCGADLHELVNLAPFTGNIALANGETAKILHSAQHRS